MPIERALPKNVQRAATLRAQAAERCVAQLHTAIEFAEKARNALTDPLAEPLQEHRHPVDEGTIAVLDIAIKILKADHAAAVRHSESCVALAEKGPVK